MSLGNWCNLFTFFTSCSAFEFRRVDIETMSKRARLWRGERNIAKQVKPCIIGPMLCRVLSGLGSILLVYGSNTLAADSSSSVNPQEGWKLATDAKDVIIYSRPHAESNLKEFRAIGFIDAPASAVHAVIDDFENYPKFMPYTAECRLIKREGDSVIGYQ